MTAPQYCTSDMDDANVHFLACSFAPGGICSDVLFPMCLGQGRGEAVCDGNGWRVTADSDRTTLLQLLCLTRVVAVPWIVMQLGGVRVCVVVVAR